MGVLITLSTECLGAFHALTDIAIRTFWLGIMTITLLLILLFRRKITFRPFSLKIGGKFEWAIFFTISAYFLITLFIALVAPPNTNDSLQYHMSRVMHWIVNRSVGFYATPIDRQLWMPPFAEYSINYPEKIRRGTSQRAIASGVKQSKAQLLLERDC